MMLHVRRVLECSEENLSLWEGSVELCSREGLLGVHLKSHNVLTSIKNEKTYKYISMNNIQLI